MADFVESATLKVIDQSSKPIAKINAAIRKLAKEAAKLNNIKVQLDTKNAQRNVDALGKAIKALPKSKQVAVAVKATGVAQAQRQLASLSKPRTVRVAVQTGGIQAAQRQLAALTKLRMVNITARLNSTVQQQLAKLPRNQNINLNFVTRGGGVNNAGKSMARAFLDTLHGGNAGATIARGFLAAIGGNLNQLVTRAGATAANAPLNKEDARQRLVAAGLDPAVINFMEQQSSELSGRFQGVTETAILEAGREAAGRITDVESPEGQARFAAVLERIARNTQITAALTGKGIEDGGNQARLIEGVIQQVGATNDPARAEQISTAILRGLQASGGDLTAADAKRLAQQLSVARGGLGEQTLQQLLLVRDEGGMRSTGDFRQFFQDLVRGNLNKNDRIAQTESGLRDAQGRSTIAESVRQDFLGTLGREIIPRLEKLGVDLTDRTAIANALDTELGLSSQAGIGFVTDAVAGFKQALEENARASRARPETFIDSPTTRQRAQAVNAQFQNVADQALGGVLPVVSEGLNQLAQGLSALNRGETGPGTLAAIGIGAVSAGVGAGLSGLATATPAERSLLLAGVGLSTSAAALTAAAGALTGAAGVQAGAGALGAAGGAAGAAAGGLRKWLPRLLKGGGFAGLGLAAIDVIEAVKPGASQAAIEMTGVRPDQKDILAPAVKMFEEAGAKINDLWAGLSKAVPATEQQAQRNREAAEKAFGSQGTPVPEDSIASQIVGWLKSQVKIGPVNAKAALPEVFGNQNVTLPNATVDLQATTVDPSKFMPATGATVALPNVTDVRLPVPDVEKPALQGLAGPGQVEGFEDLGSLTTAMQAAPSELTTAFATGNAGLSAATSQFEAATAAFGPQAAAALLAVAPTMGSIMGQAVAAAVSSATVNVNTTVATKETPRLDTGASTPF